MAVFTFPPLHLFDFATLSRLRTLNKQFHRHAATELAQMNRVHELIHYLHSLPRDRLYAAIHHLSSRDIWAIFYSLYQQHTNAVYGTRNATPPRYAYLASPTDNVHMNVYLTAAHPFGISLLSHNQIRVGIMPHIFGRVLFNLTITSTMMMCTECLETLAQGMQNTLVCMDRAVTWDAWNLRMIKIDTFRRKIFLSEEFALRSGFQGLAIISTFFPQRLDKALIRDVIFAMIT